MRVVLKREGPVQYAATAGNHTVHLDGAQKFGGTDAGMRPMEMFLATLASCSAMDVTEILEEDGHKIDSFSVDVSGERAATTPALFTHITLIYRAKGDMSLKEFTTACYVALEERCSIREMIRGNVRITFEAVLEE